MATDITEANWQYPHKDPNLEIVGFDGLAKALVDIHGPNWHGSVYNAHFNNIRTGNYQAKPHHCTYNDAAGHDMVRNCVVKGHQSYCLEWIYAGDRRVRCGARLKVVSGGCAKHPNSVDDSMNLLVKNLQAGKITSIRWGQINDPNHVADTLKDPAEIAKEENRAILAKKDAEIAAMRVGEAVDPGKFSVHPDFEDRKVQKQREEQEQRKLEAANKRKSRAGKAVKKVADEDEVPELPRKGLGKSIMKFGKKSNKPDASKWADKKGGANA